MTETKVVKITKRDNINSLLKREDLTENEKKFLIHELELLDKKNTYKVGKNAEKNEENKVFRNQILDILKNSDKGLTCSNIASLYANQNNVSITSQKIRPQLTILINDNLVENYKEKGVSLFRAIG